MSNNLPVGGLGETQFKLICESSGIVANPSITDAYGWDFNLEFPNKPPNNSMLIDSPLECKVQVKATRGKSKKVSVKLSNLKRMALYPLPCFFFFIEYNNTTPVNAYLLHLDDEWIGKILRRITEVTHGENANPEGLHKTTMLVRYDACEAIALGETDALKQKIESFVSDGMDQYVAQKLDLIAKLGFEDGAGEFSFKLKGVDEVNKLIDMSLGKESHLEVADFVGFSKRFGVSSNQPFIEAAEGTMKVFPNDKGREVIASFKTYPHEPGVEFKAHLIGSTLNKVVPNEYVKARIYTDFFDIYIKPFVGSIDLSLNCDSGKIVNILDLKKVIKLWHILGSDQESIIMKLKIDGETLDSKIKPNMKVERFEELKDACDKTIKVCDELGVSLDLINTNFSELYCCYEDIKAMSMFLFGGDFKINFNKKTTTGDEIPESEIAVILFIKFALGDRVIGAFFALVGEAEEIDKDKIEISTNKIIKGPIVTANVDETTGDEVLENLLIEFEGHLSKSGMFPVRAN